MPRSQRIKAAISDIICGLCYSSCNWLLKKLKKELVLCASIAHYYFSVSSSSVFCGGLHAMLCAWSGAYHT